MTDKELPAGEEAVVPEPLPEDEEQIKALIEAGQLGVVEGGEDEKAAEAPAEEAEAPAEAKASEDSPLEPDDPEEELAEDVELTEGVLIPANGEEYNKIHSRWVTAGKPRSFDSGKIRWLAVPDGDYIKFCVQGPVAGMENYGSLSVGGR